MKKIFTLIAMALMAVGANAQGTYAVMNGDAGVAAGTTVTSVNNLKFTWGVAGEDAFKGGNKKSEVLKDVLGSTGYCEGNGNNGTLTGGTVYYFEPLINGSLTVGFVLNGGKAFFVQESDGTNVTFTCTNAEGESITLENGGTVAEKLTGGLATFAVTAGKKYAVYCTGSKLGFYGFKFEGGTNGIQTAKATVAEQNAPAYNLAGQKVDKSFKGVVIQNGKKMIQK